MKNIHTPLKFFGFFLIFITIISSCSVNTESYELSSPTLELKAVGPLFEGSNTATATWEFSLKEILPELEDESLLHRVEITAIEVISKPGLDFPKVGKMVMEMKSAYTSMTRIGLLETNMQKEKTYKLQIAGKQEELTTAFKDERITFVGDFDMLEEDFYDDVVFDLKVTFNVEIKK